LCWELGLSPSVFDCGGGLPAESILPNGYADPDPLTVDGLAAELRVVLSLLPSCREVWLENGRHLLAAAGTLIVSVRDIKDFDGIRFLICDGGRTNHALVSDWEPHRLSTVPMRNGAPRTTVVCGPTCMAYDWLFRGQLPDTISVGDCLLWHEAGAYHIPWETRFSHGLAPVIYVDERGMTRLVRQREPFNSFWDQWVQQ
jgi:diaminopimelate decarboxylase